MHYCKTVPSKDEHGYITSISICKEEKRIMRVPTSIQYKNRQEMIQALGIKP